MVSRTIAAIGLTLLSTALAASECNWWATMRMCNMTFPVEDMSYKLCTPECLGHVNTASGLCEEGEEYYDDGNDGQSGSFTMKSIVESLGTIRMTCSNPCYAGMMAMQRGGCDLAAMCSEDSYCSISSFLADCREEQIPYSNKSYGEQLETIETQCDPCMLGYTSFLNACNGEDDMCTPYCTGLLTQATAACAQSSAAFEVDGQMMSVSSVLSHYSQYCDPCMQGYSSWSNAGCGGGEMCTPYCTGLLSKAVADCAQSSASLDMDGQMMSISSIMSRYSQQAMSMCDSSSPRRRSPGVQRRRSPGSAGCMEIPKAIAEKFSAEACSGR